MIVDPRVVGRILRMYCIDTKALVFMFNGGSLYGFTILTFLESISKINNKFILCIDCESLNIKIQYAANNPGVIAGDIFKYCMVKYTSLYSGYLLPLISRNYF